MLLNKIAAEVDTRFKDWAFRGSVVDWHYFDGQVIIKDFDIVTSDPFEPQHVCHFWGPRMSWKFMGRSIDVFHEADPGPRMQTIESRVARLRWLMERAPQRAEKCADLISRYEKLKSSIVSPSVSLPVVPSSSPTTCRHRGGRVSTIICDQCGQGKGQEKPVYECLLHGLCTHRLEKRGQEQQTPPIHICVGCEDGPWPR